jgi:phage/plasmid-like protein (TIGR03299 family)
MPANINTYIGREVAWHGLGIVKGHFMTWKEILETGGLDFQVFKSQLRDGLSRPVPAWGTFRWNNADRQAGAKDKAQFLGTVGEDYKVIPHSTGFEIVDQLVNSTDGAHYETAGALGNGEVVWGLADLKLSTHVGDDETKHFLLFHTSHDGSYSYEFRDCSTRVVCQNTLNAALSEGTKNKFRIRHTKNAMNRVMDAKEALQSLQKDVNTVAYKLQFLAGKRVTRESFTTIMDRLFPKRTKENAAGETVEVVQTRRENTLASILNLFEYNDGNAFPEQQGTAYALFNSVTNHVDHDRTGTSERAKSAMFGSGDRLKVSAFNTILEIAKDMPQVDFSQLGKRDYAYIPSKIA